LSNGNCTQVAQRESFRESRIDNGAGAHRGVTGQSLSTASTVTGKEALSDTARAAAISKIENRLRDLDPPLRKRTIPPSVWVKATRLAVHDVEGAIQLLTTWKFSS
jgi:hypothetical protein